MEPLSIGVCSWSIDRKDPIASIRAAATECGARVVHLGFFDEETLAAAHAEEIREVCADCKVEISATFAAFSGEVYKSIETVAQTGGYMPDELFEQRLDFTRRVAELSVALAVPELTIHVGTVPDDGQSGAFVKLSERCRQAATLCQERGLTLSLETGRESAEVLLQFIDGLECENVAVNFDPGNLVIYGTDDPVKAVTMLRGRISHAHLKDADPSDQPGITFGTEVTLGSGQANIARVVSKLRSGGYQGPLIVERTSGRGDPGTLNDSIDYLSSLLG